MTDIEGRALALVNEVGFIDYASFYDVDEAELRDTILHLIRESDAFRQEVSEAVGRFENVMRRYLNPPALDDALHTFLSRFIIAKTDPLVDALKAAGVSRQQREEVKATLAKRGLEIREVGE